MRLSLLVLATVLSFASAAFAAETPGGYKCTFRTGVYAHFKGGAVTTTVDKKFLGKENILIIDKVDPVLLTARITKGMSKTKVGVFKTSEFLSFSERTDNGGIIFTTIFPAAMDGKIYAVQSRHLARIGVEPLPEQGYGVCEELGKQEHE